MRGSDNDRRQDAQCRPARAPPKPKSSQRIMGSLDRLTAGIGASRRRSRRDADRGIVKAQQQHVAFDAAGRQPVARFARGATTISKQPSASAHDFLAGEAVAIAVELATSPPFGLYSVSVQKRAAGVTPATTTSQRPSSGRPLSSVDRGKCDAVAERRSAVRRCARSMPAHRDRCRRCRSSAQAVQAADRQRAESAAAGEREIHVAPRPTAVATTRATK